MTISQQISATLYFILLVLLSLATPWVIVQSLRFNARNSAWRKVRFSFRGTTGGAVVSYLQGIGVAILTLGILSPWMQWNLIRFGVDNTSFGKTPLRFRTPWGPFVATVWLGAVIIFLPGAFVLILGLLLGEAGKILAAFAPFFFFFGMLAAHAFVQMRLANLLWGGIEVGEHRLVSKQTLKGVLQLQVTNAIAIACTLGLALPWAYVRKRRYLLENLELHAKGPLLAEAAPAEKDRGAAAEALADFGDFDIGFG